MTTKPSYASGYETVQTDLVKSTILHLATILGDYHQDIVVVGGLVPTLLLPERNLPEGVQAHVGTMDVDIGLALAILDEHRYSQIAERLRTAGFEPDANVDGNPTRQRWRKVKGAAATVDFLIPSATSSSSSGKLQNLEHDFAAIVTPGLELAFLDQQEVILEGLTLDNEKAKRPFNVCGPGAFIVLKALAFRNRGENKDAYDLFYILRNYGEGVHHVVDHLKPLLRNLNTQKALEILETDFLDEDGIGPKRVAAFYGVGNDKDTRADVVGFTKQLLELVRKLPQIESTE